MKPFYQSKTMWFNIGLIIAGAAEQVAGTGALGQYGDVVISGAGVVGMILRGLTSSGIGTR